MISTHTTHEVIMMGDDFNYGCDYCNGELRPKKCPFHQKERWVSVTELNKWIQEKRMMLNNYSQMGIGLSILSDLEKELKEKQ